MVTTEEQVAARHETPEPVRRRRRAARVKTKAPAARVEPGRVAEARHRNPVWLLAGLLLVLLSALGGILLFSAQDDRVEVLVAARDLAQGSSVERGDLRIERVALDGGIDVVEPGAVDQLLGQHVVGPVPEGTMLHPAMFSPESPLGPDEMDIGAALDPGEFPQSDLPIGARVELLVSVPAEPAAAEPSVGEPAEAGEPAGSAGPAMAEAVSIGTGNVTAVEARATGQLLVTLRVSRDIGLVAAQAARDDTLRIALVGEEG